MDLLLKDSGDKLGMSEKARFEILGPLRCSVGTRELIIAQDRERALLAMLLLHAGEPVPAATLVDAIWGERPPRNARGQLHSRIWQLRTHIADAGGSRQIVVTDPVGYKIDIGPEDLDLHRFRRLGEDARAASASGHHREANDLYRAALALWRGPAFAGIDSAAVRDDSAAIDEEYACVLEECIEIELNRGKTSELIPELTKSVRRHPYRERLHAALMLALYRAGRQADALAAYQRARQLVHDNLGIELGPELRYLQRAILNRDPNLEMPQQLVTARTPTIFSPKRPRTLPPDTPDFVGRDAEQTYVRDILLHTPDRPVPVVAIAGPPGVGKTALAIHVAHSLRSHYPDGQLYTDLRGFDKGPPTAPFEVLGRFLRSLGVTGSSLPDSIDERTELFRDLLSDKRTVVVLDNAASDEQIHPLTPSGPGCGVIVSSRVRLGRTFGAVVVGLDALDALSATTLVARIIGTRRTELEPEAVSELVGLCDNLPLAIRVAAGRLAGKPHWSIAALVAQLRNERQRLDHLTLGGLDMRASISLSYAGLAHDAQRLLRVLGNAGLPEVSTWVSAALLNTASVRAEELLEQLFDSQLLEATGHEHTGQARYRLHDLVKLFASERAGAEDSPEELRAGRLRMLGAWLAAADLMSYHVHGARHLTVNSEAPRNPIDTGLRETLAAEPLRWFDIERTNILTAVLRAGEDGHAAQCWDLANITAPLYQIRGYYDERQQLLERALAATKLLADDRGRGIMLFRLGAHHTDRREFRHASEYLRKAAAILATCNDRHGNAAATAYLAMISRFQHRYPKALRGYERAATILRDSGDPGGEALALRGIGQVYLEQGDYAHADVHLQRALEVCRAHGMRRSEAQVLVWQGMLRLRQQRYREAVVLLDDVLRSCRELDDPTGQAQALRGIGLSHLQQGQLSPAREALLGALGLVVQPRPTLLEDFIRRDLVRLEQRLDDG